MFKGGHGGKSAGGWKKGGSKFGGGKPWEKKGGSGGYDRPELFSATCAKCSKTCQVPFKPNGSKPVYCSDCFKRDGDRDGGSDRPSYGEKRPYRSTPHSADSGAGNGAIEARLKSIEAKLDELIDVLTEEEGEE